MITLKNGSEFSEAEIQEFLDTIYDTAVRIRKHKELREKLRSCFPPQEDETLDEFASRTLAEEHWTDTYHCLTQHLFHQAERYMFHHSNISVTTKLSQE